MNKDEFNIGLRHAGLSQVRFAKILGVTTVTVNGWATGRRPMTRYAAAFLTAVNTVPAQARAILIDKLLTD